MPKIVTYTPLQAPTYTTVRGPGKLCIHRCIDVNDQKHTQRLPLGSVRGVVYLDALCLHCGTHLVWVDNQEPAAPGAGAEAEDGAEHPPQKKPSHS